MKEYFSKFFGLVEGVLKYKFGQAVKISGELSTIILVINQDCSRFVFAGAVVVFHIEIQIR